MEHSFITVSVIVFGYLVNEYLKPSKTIAEYYPNIGFDANVYKQSVLFYALVFFLLILLELFSIKFKKNWFFIALVLINLLLFYKIPVLL